MERGDAETLSRPFSSLSALHMESRRAPGARREPSLGPRGIGRIALFQRTPHN
jgi:hypothetical protein